MRELEAAAVGLEVASGVEEPAAAADIRKEAAVWLRREWGWEGNEDGSFRPLLDFGPGAGTRGVFRPR
jgi:hypothetical protein